MLYLLYSGNGFFVALTVLVATVCINIVKTEGSPVVGSVCRVLGSLSVAVAALSATPVAWWIALSGLGAFVAWLLLSGRASRWRIVAGATTVVVAIVAMAAEARYLFAEQDIERPSRIIVIGDSLSSGGFGESRVWASVLSHETGCPLVNLARPSDTVGAALEGQMPELPPAVQGDVVFVEIGGNDMLEGTSSRQYETSLRELARRLALDGRRVVMFELPLLPGRWAFGAAQRDAARDSGIELVPKRILARVLLEEDNTFDGLHLTQAGHDALAREVTAWAGW